MLEKCREGKHPLVEILSSSLGFDAYATVRWCPVCGAVVVDQDYDSRTNAGQIMKMRFPSYLREKTKV
jgi:valyl-tRNA synthetase